MFSAQCVAALLEAGYKPEWFGSYNHVSKQIQAAKKKCAAYDEAVKKGRKKLPPKPSADDRYLAECQSGHLSQNACFQEPGARGDPCKNTVDGHHDAQYPCMPQAGHAMQKGGEHNKATLDEQKSAGAQGKPGDPYPSGQLSKDSDKRGKAVADDKKLAVKNDRKAIKREGGRKGSRGAGASSRAGKAGAASGASGGSAAKPNQPWNKELTGKTAGDCINSFRKAGEAAMKAKCENERHKNRATANGGAGKTAEQGRKHREKLEKEAAAAQAKAAKNPRSKKAQREAAAASAGATKARNANCLANQGDRLAAGRGKNNPIVPSNASPPVTGGSKKSGRGSV